MYSIYDLLWPLVLFAGSVWWWRMSGHKQRILAFTQQYCTARGLQLLDQTLAFRKYRISRINNRLLLLGLYEFDFSTDGENRFHGEITLQGRHIKRVLLEGETVEVTEYP